MIEKDIEQKLAALATADNLRQLRMSDSDGKYIICDGRRYVNLSSNDYLGLAADLTLQHEFLAGLSPDRFLMSNPASRLMTGNSPDYEALEASLARLYPGRAVLVLGCGYLVNSGVLPALTEKGDLILADKLVHASLIDGLRLCECDWRRFNHNDMEHLETLLRRLRGQYRRVWVVTESVFSMDGDRAPLRQLVELRRHYDVQLYVDEAHAFGIYGSVDAPGSGLAAEMGVVNEIDLLVGTFGKALASCGAFVAVDPLVREWLVNRMRPLIFSTALPPLNLQWTHFLIERLPEMTARRQHLRQLIDMLRPGEETATQIIPLLTGDNAGALVLAGRFREAGFWTTPIRWPTVPQGRARVRISLSAALSEEDLGQFMEVWKSIG